MNVKGRAREEREDQAGRTETGTPESQIKKTGQLFLCRFIYVQSSVSFLCITGERKGKGGQGGRSCEYVHIVSNH